MKTGVRLWISIALLFPALGWAQSTSETDELLRRALMRFPQADTDGDGILTPAEALTLRFI